MTSGARSGLLRRLATRAESWLFLLTAGVFVRFWALGHLEPRISNDAVSYEWPWELMTLGDMLQHVRTFGYPIFLRIWWLFADDYAALPTVHLLFYFLAVALFWRALAAYSGSPWLALAAAVPLLTSSLLPFFRFVQPELMAPAMAILTIALVFRLALRPTSKLLWIGVTAATLATYHLRPIYLAIAVVVPLVGILLRFLLERREHRLWKRFSLGLVAAALVPLFAYCGFRSAVVGHFGVINLLGYELVAITSNFLDPETVAALPEDYRELGQKILKYRTLRGWTPYTRDSHSYTHFRQYGQNQWYIAEPLARHILMRNRRAYRAARGEEALPISPLEARQIENADFPPLGGDLARAINDYFEGFGKELIRQKPYLYRKWVKDSILYGLSRASEEPWIRWPALALAVSLPIFWVARRRSRAGPDPPAESSIAAPGETAAVAALLLLGASFFLGSLTLMSLVSWPWDRYLFGAELFLPSALVSWLFVLCTRLVVPRQAAHNS